MSFDVYLQRFDHGHQSGFSLTQLRAIFHDNLVELEEDFWQLRFSNSDSSDLFLQPGAADPTLIHTLSVHRPSNDPRLWHALFALLEAPGSLFHFPGCAAPLTRDANIVAAMPPDLLAALGAPLRIDNSDQLRQAIATL